jgi:hypothetical protein
MESIEFYVQPYLISSCNSNILYMYFALVCKGIDNLPFDIGIS